MTEALSGPTISVVIPTKNAGPLFQRVLASVVDQQVSGELEVMVVDSGSTDETLEIARRYPQVRLIEIPPTEFGHGKTRNFAVSQARGEFVAMITQDALPASPDWLEKMCEPLLAMPAVAGVFGRHLAYPEATAFTRNELIAHFDGFRSHPVVGLSEPERYLVDEGYRQFLYFFSDNNAMLRRSVWEKLPYPEVDFAEDQAWARLIIEAGHQKAYAHDACVYHSHDYGLIERLQRSFDESYSLRKLFDYKGATGIRHALRSFLALTLRDLRYSWKSKLYRSKPGQVARMPLDNMMRVTGAFLGEHAQRIPMALRLRLSRDRRLMQIDDWSRRP
ncbi:glycosyltransferase family 2 protein [Pseudomonas nitroreducens]|uniref:glycosyltransferase family 2 protein n=1 Tax=Pseudomonas TaxID=286 RepID=UPI0002D43CBA|nr:glycosyltransferase family 2 protein [Pseudomonas nitroreducens]